MTTCAKGETAEPITFRRHTDAATGRRWVTVDWWPRYTEIDNALLVPGAMMNVLIEGGRVTFFVENGQATYELGAPDIFRMVRPAQLVSSRLSE